MKNTTQANAVLEAKEQDKFYAKFPGVTVFYESNTDSAWDGWFEAKNNFQFAAQ